MKNTKLEVLSIATLLAVSANVSAFNNGDIINFEPGVTECLIPGICVYIPELETVTQGSYFALDLNYNGNFEPHERIALSPGPDGGIIIGALQPGSGIDMPWGFSNDFGSHQTTTIPVTQNVDGSLDFSGWEAVWGNHIFSLGIGSSATVSCNGPLPCNVNDSYQIDYTAYVTSPSFYGLGYQLHLENTAVIPSLEVSIALNGASVQECASTGGHNVTATASVDLINGAQLDTLQWTVDGQATGTGPSISPFISLGSHTISVTATSISGYQDTDNTNITVVDTTAPTVSASFTDSRSGTEISSIDTPSSSFVGVSINAVDICDSSPGTSAIGGFSLTDGDTLKIQGNQDKVELRTSEIEVNATATDASSNSAKTSKTLTITP